MRTVVTGGAGFIGSHLSEALVRDGHEVHILDNLSSGKKEWVPPGSTLHQTDLTQPEAAGLIGQLRPEVVFHLAAQADVQRSIADPALDADVNITGTVRLLEACRKHGAGRFVFASTSGVYGDSSSPLLSEDAPAAPLSYYGQSKLAAEGYIRIFNRLYGLPYTILRYGNVYGPRQTPKGEGGVVAVFMERLRQNLPLGIHGDGEQTRDFIYVRDVVEANLSAASAPGSGVYHVSTGRPTTIRRIAELLGDFRGQEVPIHFTPPRPGDIRHSCLDNTRAKQSLGWSPRFRVEEGLLDTYTSFLGK
ncbi:NAD-dependent epimerase/dehydratase family protein [Paenibacillus lutrae]|uniref:NAD-dependent epimerase/dehydratase family protein n=1 Tax=Paenibacillus lutrae TaxID=2078573 RepID=A0A7X3FDV6_9BACL|nr:NAD-dependent epimerase/dehydratase family protein [Paenibacillus lutrae]MVO97956.1 NAD-dependent epimerase/dehydratase family protein [Paenibacillus lutrae]